MPNVHSGAAAVAAALFICTLASAFPRGAEAAAQFSIEPLLLRLPANKLATSLTLGNVGSKPVTVHTELVSWHQDQGEDAYGAASGLIVSPPIFNLAPGAQQIVRIGRAKRGAAPAREQAYRIRLSEVPPKASDARAVATHMQINLPIFVPPADRDAKAALAIKGVRQAAGGLVIALANAGLVHDKVTRVALLQDGKIVAERSINFYVLAGAQRELALPKMIPAGRSGPAQVELTLPGRKRVLVHTVTLQAVAPEPLAAPDPAPAPKD